MTFSRILVAVDGTPQSDAALALAARLAVDQGATLTIATVEPRPAERFAPPDMVVDPTIDERLDDAAHTLLRRAADTARALGANAQTCLREGPVVDAILQCVDEHRADLLVVGTHGRTGLARALQGSIAEGVLRHSHVPVLIARTA
jgi:nucleotide-binding universal stress UspA family protein